MKKSVFWWEIAESLVPMRHGNFPKEVDFIVVGAGYTGLSAALTIARKGRSVAVVDSKKPGLGASTRNGGICSGNLRLSHGKISKKYGEAFADAAYAEGIEARLDLASFCEEENIECDFQLTGRFTGAMCAKDYEKQAEEVERLGKVDGHNAHMIGRADQYGEIATDLFHGGMVREEIGGFHPAKFFAGLLRCVEAAGVIILPNTIVFDIDHISKDKKAVITSNGKITAGKVIVATNAYTSNKYPVGKFLKKRLVAAQSAIIVTEKLGIEQVKTLMPGMRMYGNTANLYSYFRPTPDKERILLGSRSFDKVEVQDRTIKYLQSKLSQVFPQLSDCGIDFAWLGNVGFTRAQLPAIFENNSIFYAAGYAGSGTVWARWLGKKVAETAMATANRPSVFFGPPPKSIPFYDGNPWFLPAVQYAYSIKDWIKLNV